MSRTDPGSELEALVATEMDRRPSAAAARLVGEILARFGDSLAAVVFYGSCLRTQSDKGVFDFYAIVDDYASAYPLARGLRALNRILPPNVFLIEAAGDEAPLRGKVAVLSARDFEHSTGPGALRSGIWARFCQPSIAAFVRDPAARTMLHRGAARSVTTALERILPLLPSDANSAAVRFRSEEFWNTAFAATYTNEMRAESRDSIASLHDADPERYERAARIGLAVLAGRGALPPEATNDRDDPAAAEVEVRLDAATARRARRSWRLRRPLAKAAYAAQLAKSAFTFGDWLPYVLWKVERHSGTRIVPTERQRRHPWVWGWPILFRVLARRDLR